MTQSIEVPTSGQPETEVRPVGWIAAWWAALTQPTVAGYKRLIDNPNATLGRAYLWVFGAGFAAYLCVTPVMAAMVSRFLVGVGLMTESEALAQNAAYIGQNGVVLCLGPFGFLMEFAIAHAVVRMFGAQGEYRRFLYVGAAIFAPLTLVSAFIGPIPILGLVNIPLTLIAIAMSVVAVQAVYNVGWVKAIGARIAGVLVVAAVTVCILTLLGPSVGDAYLNTIEQMNAESR